MQASARMRHAVQRLQDLIYHVSLLDVSRRRGDVDGLSILQHLSLNEALSEVHAYGLPLHGRRHKHAAMNSGQVWHRVENVREVTLIVRHMLTLHDETYLEPLDLQFMLSCRVSLDFTVEAGGDDPSANGQVTSLELFQAAVCRPVISLPCSSLPNRRQSLVAHRRTVVLWGLTQSGQSRINRGVPCSLLRRLSLPAALTLP